MTFRARILLACLAVAVLPLTIFALGARRTVRERLAAQFAERVTATTAIIRDDLERTARSIDTRLRGLAELIDDESALRVALLQRGERAVALDYAARVMPSANLDYLLLLDSAGTVLSSGHFRNEFDRTMPGARALVESDAATLVLARRAQGSFLALVAAHPFRVGDRSFILAGGVEVDSTFVRGLARDDDNAIALSLDYPGGSIVSVEAGPLAAQGYSEQIALPFLDDVDEVAGVGEARWTVTHSLAALQAVQRGIDVWFLGAVAGAILLALLIAQLLAARVNRPLEELARRSTRVDLERLDVSFATRRADEIGTLSRMLDLMVHRLRGSAQQLRAAERRATVGDLARQVNHDVRNGLLPIRNVIRHLAEVARAQPEELSAVFAERESTLSSGIAYLEGLATNYARLSPRVEPQVCDLNAVVRAVVEHAPATDGARVRLDLSDVAPRVSADPVALRRVVENLVINALDSLERAEGTLTVRTSVAGVATDRLVTLTVADTGSGIDAAALDRIFDDFYTTKERGTGLGLSIVRRLVADMGGRMRVESERGRGSAFHVELPEAS